MPNETDDINIALKSFNARVRAAKEAADTTEREHRDLTNVRATRAEALAAIPDILAPHAERGRDRLQHHLKLLTYHADSDEMRRRQQGMDIFGGTDGERQDVAVYLYHDLIVARCRDALNEMKWPDDAMTRAKRDAALPKARQAADEAQAALDRLIDEAQAIGITISGI